MSIIVNHASSSDTSEVLERVHAISQSVNKQWQAYNDQQERT
jgi:hypothetical protein